MQDYRQSISWRILRIFRANLFNFWKSFKFIRLRNLILQLQGCPDFPGSSASDQQLLSLSILGFHETFPALLQLKNMYSESGKLEIKQASAMYKLNEEVLILRKIFDVNSSDKGSYHNYDLVYANLFADRSSAIEILEIGLGTNNTDTPSNMGRKGVPGASLKSWKEFYPNSNIVGCDIDQRVLFRDERILTYQLDQTSTSSWETLRQTLGERKFDLIIDDGLHAPYANLRTIIEASTLLRKSGLIVIEDVWEPALVVWKIIPDLLGPTWDVQILKTNRSNLVLIKRGQ